MVSYGDCLGHRCARTWHSYSTSRMRCFNRVDDRAKETADGPLTTQHTALKVGGPFSADCRYAAYCVVDCSIFAPPYTTIATRRAESGAMRKHFHMGIVVDPLTRYRLWGWLALRCSLQALARQPSQPCPLRKRSVSSALSGSASWGPWGRLRPLYSNRRHAMARRRVPFSTLPCAALLHAYLST
jgi:hypothetical protein